MICGSIGAMSYFVWRCTRRRAGPDDWEAWHEVHDADRNIPTRPGVESEIVAEVESAEWARRLAGTRAEEGVTALTIILDPKNGTISTRAHPPLNPLQMLAVCRLVETHIVGGTAEGSGSTERG